MALLSRLDIRIRLLLMVLVSVISLLLHTEIALALAFVSLCIWMWLFGLKRQVLSHVIWYFALWGGLYLIRDIPILGSTSLPLVTVYIRRIMLPVMAARVVAAAPSGQLIATLDRMKIPKAVTLSLAILFRFLPTIREEYSHIRDGQKFRGIATSFMEGICHPFSTLEYTLIPLLIRTSKIADELSASASVRGVKLKGQSSSWHDIQLGRWDWCIGCVGSLILVGSLFIDQFVGG